MIVIYIILALIVTILIVALFISKNLDYEKSIKIESPIELVWEKISSLSAMDKWSPWKEKDPKMQQNITGTDGQVGAEQHWESNVKGVGAGSQRIVNVVKPTLFETKLNFIKPFKSTADGYVKLEKVGDGTVTTWGFKSKMSYPMNIMKLFMNFEKSMDSDFGKGLNKLKEICTSK